MDLPADIIQGAVKDAAEIQEISPVSEGPKGAAEEAKFFRLSRMLKSAKAPLVVIGKGAAYAGAEVAIRDLIDRTNLPFLPTPMGKGVLPDSHPSNVASARSTALKEADIVLILGARLSWILHFGDSPKWSSNVQFIQIDILTEELSRNHSRSMSLSMLGDLTTIVPQLTAALGSWHYVRDTPYTQHLHASTQKNLAAATTIAASTALPMTYSRALSTIERTLHQLSP